MAGSERILSRGLIPFNKNYTLKKKVIARSDMEGFRVSPGGREGLWELGFGFRLASVSASFLSPPPPPLRGTPGPGRTDSPPLHSPVALLSAESSG